jgi:succinate dehydrogenase hydrophobic anchor subunit
VYLLNRFVYLDNNINQGGHRLKMSEANSNTSSNNTLLAVSAAALAVFGVGTLAYTAKQKRAQERKAMDAFFNSRM